MLSPASYLKRNWTAWTTDGSAHDGISPSNEGTQGEEGSGSEEEPVNLSSKSVSPLTSGMSAAEPNHQLMFTLEA